MTDLTPSIAEDIQMLANYWLDIRNYSHEEYAELKRAAANVDAYLSSFKPDHL